MPGTNLDVVVNGRYLSLDSRYGDIEMSTVYPGGSDELSWAPGTQSPLKFSGSELVEARCGGVPVWAGRLIEPDASQDRLVAQGAWREGDDFAALTAGGLPGTGPNQSIDAAIARGTGLKWTRPVSISGSAVEIDVTQGPVNVGTLLDTYCANNNVNWLVTPYREVYAVADPTTPIYQTLPMAGGLGYALDGYASALIGRYFSSTTSAYVTTAPVIDANAVGGYVEQIVDLTGRGPITAARATAILTSLLAHGRSVPQWTSPLELAYGEILTMGCTPVALEAVAAGNVIRVNGGYELAQRANGAMYVDMLIGATSLADGLITIRPLQMAARSYQDILTKLAQDKKKAS